MPCAAAQPLADVLACRSLSDSAARLACFDRVTADLDANAIPAPAAAAAPAVTAPPAAPILDPKQQFGLPEKSVVKQEVAAGTRASDAAKIDAHITNISRTANGRTLFMLDNDQVWRQLLAEGIVLAKRGDPVTISRGLLGSYWLQMKDGRGYKVTRLQ
jgi:hypothetical protein